MRILDPVQVKSGNYAGKWYVGVEESDGNTGWLYLHTDLQIREGTASEDRKSRTGYFINEECARAAKIVWEMQNS